MVALIIGNNLRSDCTFKSYRARISTKLLFRQRVHISSNTLAARQYRIGGSQYMRKALLGSLIALFLCSGAAFAENGRYDRWQDRKDIRHDRRGIRHERRD